MSAVQRNFMVEGTCDRPMIFEDDTYSSQIESRGFLKKAWTTGKCLPEIVRKNIEYVGNESEIA